MTDKKGVLFAVGAYLCWGFFPIYWRLLKQVPAMEILAHRMVWSLVFLAALLAGLRRWAWLKDALRQPKTVLTFAASAALLSANWFIYIWAVNAGHIVETSLGYFINPLVNVLLGVAFLKERLRVWQKLAVLVAATGVLYLGISYGQVPWISLSLGISFGFYGLIRKLAKLASLEGLFLETALLSVFALGFLVFEGAHGRSSFGAGSSAQINALLMGAGVATAVPLLLFAGAARRIPLVTIGVLQYMAPTIQLLLGVLVYGEPFDHRRALGFGMVWFALLIYSVEGLWRWQRQRRELRALA